MLYPFLFTKVYASSGAGQQDYYKIHCDLLQFKNTVSIIVVPIPLPNLHILKFLSRESDFKVRCKT